MKVRIEPERETDGRWIGEVVAVPGAQLYAKSRKEAARAAVALALRILADRLEATSAEPIPTVLKVPLP
ncbi:MAG: type II toxin-antitoxin system HicB family antitoxin [Myxococcales bacterium]|nr:type II toxin-antitoxin system HicB family antitoxin [Myxococcales bacterium]